MTRRVYVEADFSQLETWLTAWASGDATMMAELQAQLTGGHKIHALNAAMIYKIDPLDAKKHMVNLKGNEVPAYDGGKRLGHGWNYGMKPPKMAAQFWIELPFAREVFSALNAKYPEVVRWRERLLDEVFGVASFVCPLCAHVGSERANCPRCSGLQRPVTLKWNGYVQPPTHRLATPFGRHRWYHGRRGECANAVASQIPQSCGASIWYRTLARLNDPEWPCPVPRAKLSIVEYAEARVRQRPGEVAVASGTYDSYKLECDEGDAPVVADWLAWTMEQPWPQLGNMRFPVEVEIGLPGDMVDTHYKAFSAGGPSTW